MTIRKTEPIPVSRTTSAEVSALRPRASAVPWAGARMTTLAERRGKGVRAVETGETKKIIKLAAPDAIENHYTFEDPVSKTLTRATKVKSDTEGTATYISRIVRKDVFGPVVDPSVASTKLSEFDWQKTILSIYNTAGVGQNLINFHELIETEEAYYLIMEEYQDADMMKSLLQSDLDEAYAKRIVRQLLQGLSALHSQGMVHRDVNPKNIRFRGSSVEKSELVLLPSKDVALHEPTSPKHQVTTEETEAGEELSAFHAPERLLGEFSSASDLWSVGVLTYLLITGQPPVTVPVGSPEEMYRHLKAHPIDFDCDPWPDFPEARDFCAQLLQVDPELRTPTSRDALSHPWLTEPEEDAAEASVEAEL
jgi:serine/threonine protein kinase